MKKVDVITSLVLIPIDYCMLVLAGITSYFLRYQSAVTYFRPVFFDYEFSAYLPLVIFTAFVGVIFFATSGLYALSTSFTYPALFSKIFLGVSTTVLVIIVSIFLRRELFSSRFVIIVAWLLAILYVFVARVITRKIRDAILARGHGTHTVALIGTNKAASDIAEYFSKNSRVGVRIIHHFTSYNADTLQQLRMLALRQQIDEVLDTADEIDRTEREQLINLCNEQSITFRYLANISSIHLLNYEVDSVAGYPIIQINRTRLIGWGRIWKRAFDIMVSGVLLVLFIPFFTIIALWIWHDSGGPILVQLRRVGRGGRIFLLLKFRSMIPNAHSMKPSLQSLNERRDGPLFKMTNDPRVTRAGRYLRRMSLDELPQLWNVLRGDMSLVGPRPHEPEEVARYEQAHKDLLAIQPGMTGLSQVSGRSNLLFAEEVRLELFYLEHWSFGLDIRILFRTFFVLLKARDAV